MLFALSPISVDIDDPDGYATPVNGFLGGVIAADLASPGWWRDKRFDILNGGLTAIPSLDDSDVPDPLYLEAALAGAIDAAAGPARYDQILADRGFAAGFPQILYGASPPDKIYGEGLHYIRVGDREMSASRPVTITRRDGQDFSHFNPITRAGEQASTVLFAFKRIVRDASASGGYRFVDGEEFDRGFQLGIATVAGSANGEWRSRLLTLAYRDGDDVPLEGVLPNAEFVANPLCRIFVSGRRYDRAYGDEIGDSSANAARWRFAVDEKDGRGKVDGVYYWRIGDEYAPGIDITRAGGLFNPYRFDPVKGKCVAAEIGFALGEPSSPPSLPHPRGADGGFYLGRAAFDVGKEPADDDRRIEYVSDFDDLRIEGGNVLVSDDNKAFRVFLAARGDDLFTVVFPAPRFLLADAPLAGVYAYNGAGEFVPLGQSGGGVGSFHPTTISADNEAIVVFYDKSRAPIATLVAKIGAGGEFNIDDLIGADNTNLRLALLGTLSRLRDNNLSVGGLFPRFIDAPVLDLDYLPIKFDENNKVTVTVSRRTGTVGVVGSFNPGVDVDEVFFAIGTISLVDLGSVSDNPPPPYPPEHGALFNLFPHSGGFTAHFPSKVQTGVSVSGRQTGVSVNGAWLGILRRPSHGWGGQVFSPYDFDIFGGATRRNERVWAIARFLQAADPDFPRPGATDNLPPEDQEIFLHNEAIAWASESGREVGFSAGDNGKLTLNTTLNVDAGDILVLKDEALETEVPASEASVGIKILDTLTLQFDSLAAAAGHLQAGISAFSQPPAAFADAPTTRDDSVLDFLPALSVFIHPFAERTPLGLPYYFNRYSFSQGVNGKESRVPTVEGVSFDERTGEFVIDDYPGDRARGLAATMFIGYLHGEETRYRVIELQGARDFGVAASAEAITLTIDGAVLITFAHPNYLVSIADAFEQNYSSFAPPPERETIEASSFTWLFQALNFNTLYIEPIPRNNCLGEFIDRDDFFVFPSAGGEILVRYADAGDNCRRNADLPPPATSLRATVAFAAGDFQIEWDAVAGAIYYKLYRSADGGSPDRVGGDIADLEFVDRGLAVGIRYAYQVRACNNAGCSPLSPAVEVESLATPILSAQVISKNGDGVAIALLWSEESATRFEIERALTLTGTYQSIADGEFAFSFRFVDSDVEAGTTYYYRLRLCNDFACSVYSEIVSITADAPSPNVSPTFTGTEEGKSQITLSWQEVPGAVSYRVLRSLPGEQFEVVADNLQTPEYIDTGLLAKQDYEYRVESCDADGNCAPVGNDLVVVRRPQPAPPEVVSSRIVIDGSATVSLSWNEITGATLYRLLGADSEDGDYLEVFQTTTTISSTAETFPGGVRPDGVLRSRPNGIVRYYLLEVCSVFGCGRSAVTKLSLAPLSAPIVSSSPFGIDLVIDFDTMDANATLEWNQIDNALLYNVLRSTDGAGGPYVALTMIIITLTLDKPPLIFADDDLTVGSVYHYRLRACNVFGCGLSDPVELAAIDMIRIDSPSNVAVQANAQEGAKLFTASFITVSREEEENASFDPAANDDFRTGGGEQAVVLLARAATAVFDSDGATRYFVLRARDAEERATVTVRLVSEPRAISPAPREVVLVTTEALRGSVALHRRDSGLSIWHNGNSTLTYSLRGETDSSGNVLFGVNAAYGLVTVNAPSLTVGTYDIELLLADEAISLTATLELQVRVIPDPEVVALQVFLDEIASGARQWQGGVSDDWDGDGIANPYDWTPTKVAIPGVDEMVTVNLTLGGADGSAGSPWPIYNVWQLQAIASVSVAINGTVSDGLALFGGGDNAAAHYRLATDIDATPTRNWGDGFTPIGSEFVGSFDGEGREIRGLFINRSGDAAMFLNIGANTDATGLVSRLGLPDVEIRGIGDDSVAALAVINSGVVSQVWATGEIAATVGRASGLVREMLGGLIQESWFVGRVISGSGAGGLVGYGEEGEIQDSWVVAQVEWSGIGGGAIGGLVGDSVDTFTLNQSWSGGGLAATLIGGEVTVVGNNYFDRSISRASVSVHSDVLTVDTMVTVSDADAGWDSTTWSFGDTADYPFLQRIEDLRPGLQAVAFADYQTDLILSGAALPADGETIPLTVGMSLALILDTNGLATAHAPTPTCSDDANGVITAQTNYNDVTVQLQKIGDDESAMSFTADCGINIGYKDDASSYRRFAVSMIIASQESTVSRVYSFKLASPFSPLPADIFVPANASEGYEFLTLTMHVGELIQDGSGLVSVKGIANPPVVLTLVQPFTTTATPPVVGAYTTTITTSVPTRDSAVGATQKEGSLLVFSLLKGGATALFANDDEIFVLSSLGVIIEGRTETTDTAANLRSLPRVRVATPSPREIALTQNRVGLTVLAPGGAGIAIWHNFGAPETISITQSGAYFGVDEATGLVTIATQLSVDSTYGLTMELTDGTFTATREFRFVVGRAEKGKLVVLNLGRSAGSDETTVTLGWRPVVGADSYTLSRADGDEAGTYLTIYEGAGEAVDECTVSGFAPGVGCNPLADWLVFTDSTLTLGSVYYYQLDSCGDLGCATSDTLSLSVSASPQIYDSAPAENPTIEIVNIRHGPDSPEAILAWDVLLTVTEGVNGDGDSYTLTNALRYEYRLSRSSESDSGYIEVHNESPLQNDRQLAYVDVDLTLASVYYYRLSVCNDVGCAAPPSSVTLTVTGLDLDAPEIDTLVSRDASLASVVITLTWSPIDGATEYRVSRLSLTIERDEGVTRYADGRVEYRLLKDLDLDYVEIYKGAVVMDLVITTPSSTMTVLAHPDTVSHTGTYYYQVEACDAGGCGDSSNAARVGPTPLPPAIDVPNLAITDFELADNVNQISVEAGLKWSEVEGADNYRLLRAPIERGIDGEYDVIYEGRDLSFTDSDLRSGENYYYRVRACDGSNCGHPSEAVTLRLEQPGRARILFDRSGSAREVKSIHGAPIALSSITLAWEETPNAQYYYVVRGGEFVHQMSVRHTISDPRDGEPLPMSSTTYRDNLQGDDVRHYWVQACNAFGCAELSDPVALGGGLLGIDEEDNPRAAGVSVALTLIDASATDDEVVDLILTNLVQTPSEISSFACRADVVTEVVNGETISSGGGPRIDFDWEGRAKGEAVGRFYRFARSRYADDTSADWVDITAPATLHPDTDLPLNTGNPLTSDPTNFAATTFIDHSPFNENDIRSNFAATTLYYSVQECVAVRGDAQVVIDLEFYPDRTVNLHEAPICSAPLVVAVAPKSSLPQCADGAIETPLPKVNIRPELSGAELIPLYEIDDRETVVTVDSFGNEITVTYSGSQYVFADVSFAVRWDSVADAVYYRVTRSTRDSGGEARFDSLAIGFLDGREVIEHFDRVPLTRGLVNVYWVQACDNVNGCGPLSDPLELVAPSTDLAKSVVPVPLVVLVSVDSNLVTSGFVASVDVVAPPFADRYILSRAPNPASGETAVYVNLREEDVAVFNHVDRELETGEQYLYRTQACNAAICITSDPNLVSVGLPNSLPGAPPVAKTPTPEATESVVDNKPQVDLRWAIVANVDAYTLTRSTKPDGSEAATIQISRERTYTDRNVEFDTGYYYQLQACNASGCAGKSDILSVTVSTPLSPTGDTPAPRARGEVANDLPQVSLGWDAVAEADRYIVTRSVNEDGEYGVIYTGGNLSHIDRGVKFDSPYYYRVQACNYFGCADVSEAASASVPTPADQLALAEFIKQIAMDDFDWFGDRETASSIDWDNDGITNPYDWTPTSVTIRGQPVEVNLTLGIRGEAGTNFDPWPIYNVWQLQAIDGVSVSQTGEASVNFELFGDEESRLNARYRLAMDIDATPTRQWDSEAGFNPIGGSFGGRFDGRGNVVRGLFIDRADEEDVGLFADITNIGFLAVRDLGVEEADIRGERNVGIIAGSVIDADLLRVWSTGKVYGSDYYVGGVAGFFYANESDGKAGVRASWSAADVEGKAFVGGLVGQSFEVALQNAFSNNWSAGAVRGGKSAAGLVGGSTRTKYVASWTAGAVSGDSELAAFAGRGSANEYENAYWNANTSGVADSGAVGVVVQTLTADQLVSSLSDFGRSITVNAWDVGDSELGVDDNSADFPLLRAFSRPLQAVYLARALTRILPTGSTATVAAESGTTFRAGGIRLDTNGLADNDGADGTSTPTCSFADGVLQAAANYNGITVEMSMLTDAKVTLIALPGDATENCELGIQNTLEPTKPFDAFDATLRLEISAPATLSFDARRLTVEHAVRIESLAAERALLEFVEQIGADDFNWFVNTIDWDGDGITNPYDWTPTVGVNLLLDGADGSAEYPWPIYNVWQLQAIDGMSVSQDGEATRGLSFFGGDRLGEQYRLAVNIDATPTEQWDGGAGFDPIGGDFAGYLDGGGYAVRGLFINRAIPEVGLFGRIVKSGELAVSDLGLENANISGGNQTGILVGNLNANLAKVWTTGKVVGAGDDEESGVGGLAGVFATRQNAQSITDSVILSWSAAQVSGDNKVGGLIGGNLLAHRSQLIDNWAGGNVSGGVTVGGFVGNPANAEFIRSWSAGEVSGSVTGGFAAGPGGNAVYSSVYWNADSSGQTVSAGGVSVAVQVLSVSDFGGTIAAAAWNFGDSAFSGTDKVADFPFLKVHSQPLQAVNLANALTRILGVTDASTIAMATGMTLTTDIIRIDTNRMAADERTDGTSSPDCSFDAATGVLRATTNYNGVTVDMRLLGSGDDRRLTISADSELDKCEIGVFSVDDAFDATIRVETFAPAMDGDAARGLTTDYAFRLALPPLSDDEAAAAAKVVFEAQIEAGDFDWFADDRENTSTAIDWDGDGIANPYDWTPTSVTVRSVLVGVNLTLDGVPDGSAGNPWPIYNVWQLQAIDGLSVSETGVTASLAYFGAEASVALSLEYNLAVNIDATPTEGWDKDDEFNPAGFNPIGGDDAFTGFLDGGGNAVRGLFIDRATDNVGLFANITKNGELAVRDLGVEDADISGGATVGILAGEVDAGLNNVWTTGNADGGNDVGGLAGAFVATGSTKGNTIMMSWSAADVTGDNRVGGFIGNSAHSQTSDLFDNWALGNVSGGEEVGGFSGNSSSNTTYTGNWSAGAVSGGVTVGGFDGGSTSSFYNSTYWNLDTSGQTDSGGGVGVVVQTLAASDFGGEADSAAWNFGDSDLSDGDADFPLLATLSQPWQAVNLARVLTRVFGVSGDTEVVVAAGETITADKFRIDTNGLAPDERTDGTSSPSCSIVDIDGESVFRAETNYNSVTVDMRLLTRGNEKFIEAETPEEAANCEVRIESRAVEFAAILRLEISAPAIGEDNPAQAARGLTVDYALQISLTESTIDPVEEAPAAFIDEIESGDIDWFGDDSRIVGDGTALDWDGDGINNPYDYTPTSVAIDGMTVGINLTAGLTGPGGTADNPWPIYNVWQLQAIDGMSVSRSGSMSPNLTLFGAIESARLGAEYRLATNIDATQTEQWDGNRGFDPIGNIRGGGFGFAPFTGFFDGGGYAVRGLFIDRLAQNIGLFVGIVKRGELAVLNLGVEDANIGAGNSAGILAGSIDANISKVWTTGVLRGDADAGGLAGTFIGEGAGAANTIMMSWSTADVITADPSNRNRAGGLVGFSAVRSGAFFDDNWAAGNVSGNGEVGGFIGTSTSTSSSHTTFTRNWSAGAVAGDPEPGGFAGRDGNTEYTSIYWNEDTSNQTDSAGGGEAAVVQTLIAANFGGVAESAAWDFGDSVLSADDNVADFPLLKSHSRPWQAVNLARALTRIMGVGDAADIVATAETLLTTDGFRLDANGLADDERTDGTSAPICSFNNGVVRAQTNYNGVEIAFRLLTDGDQRFVAAADNDCEVAFENATGRFEATLRLEISAPAIPDPDSSTPSLDNDPARVLVTDYALTIAPDPNVAARAILVREAAASGWFSDNLTVGASGTATDWDGDGIDNPYDWTPTSVAIDGMTIGVNLTLRRRARTGRRALRGRFTMCGSCRRLTA